MKIDRARHVAPTSMLFRFSTNWRVLALFFIVRFADSAFAVTLNVSVDDETRGVTVSVFDVTSTSGCEITIFNGKTGRELSSARTGRVVVARAIGGGGATIFKAKSVPAVQTSLGSAYRGQVTYQSFFRAAVSCNGIKKESLVTAARFPTASDGVAFDEWLRAFRRKLKPAEYQVTDAFPGAKFERPLDVRAVSEGGGRILVVEQGGVVWSLSSSGKKEAFLDLSSKTQVSGEQGLLGMALHPRFHENGFVYVNYIKFPEGNTVISRFTATGSPSVAALDSELPLLVVDQVTPIHKGGALAFGPDGYLYIGLGDGGAAGDPRGNAQNLRSFLGKVLRIDVDATEGGKPYAVPLSNPFRESLSAQPEIFAYGFRNPFRFSFDLPTGRLWLGDVGQNRIEEIDIVESGKNYGWNTLEGTRCYPAGNSCNRRGMTGPVAEYDHSDGFSITGGYVYRGSKLPSLNGKYIFADFVAGTVWALNFNGSKASRTELFDTDLFFSSLGIDLAGELLLVSYGDGVIYRLAPTVNAQNSNIS